MSARYAVIFDMDGVLIDSYDAHFRSWQMMAAREGLEMTRQQFEATFGRTSREVIAALWKDVAMDAARVQRLDDEKEAAFREILAQDFPAMPGAIDLLDALKGEGVALAIGSSAPPANVEQALDHLGSRDRWGAVVTGQDVRHGKPDPQVFLLAAERLGIRPERCAVVEDAPVGIEAARRAGMAVVGLASRGRTREMLVAADLVVESLMELDPPRFARLIEHPRP